MPENLRARDWDGNDSFLGMSQFFELEPPPFKGAASEFRIGDLKFQTQGWPSFEILIQFPPGTADVTLWNCSDRINSEFKL